MNRKTKLILNTFSSLLFQLTAIICGFILPRLILTAFGSDVNGLVNSISQYLGIISFLELGVGAVVQSSLYKPLSEHNEEQVSRIITSANKFFRTIAGILIFYVLILIFVYPLFVSKNYDHIYVATLIFAISISTFAQYYFGIVNRLLLTADQRGYVHYFIQTIAVIFNTFSCFVLIKLGFSIQIVKLATSIIYLAQPLAVYLYVRNHYKINYHAKYKEEPIKQKWNGIAQHVAAVVLDNTDVIVLTTFSTLSNVSIYSVYLLVIKGVKQLFMSMTNGVTSLIGELWAKQNLEELKKVFGWTEWIIHTGTTFVFGVTAILIVPFVEVYTYGVTDANYIQPLFGFLIVMANAGHCLRLPYNIMILAGGHYKQTQNNYIIAAILNIIISVFSVKRFGLVGVAIGTIIAMFYQTIWMALYNSRNFICWDFSNVIKQLIVDMITVIIMYLTASHLSVSSINYFRWFILAIKTCSLAAVIIIIINLLFYRNKVILLFNKIRERF